MEDKNTGNKGEWSELYVLAKLLTEGKLYISDENLSKNERIFYEINEITTAQESFKPLIYKIINSDEILILNPQNDKEIKIQRSVIKNKVAAFLNEIMSGTKNQKLVGNEIKTILERKNISATSKHKSDLIIRSYDPRVRSITQSGYSIKSKLGSASTLFNSSQATNLVYQVLGLNDSSIQPINQEKSCRSRIQKIYELGGRLNFLETQNEIFKNNLMMVDGYFNKILAAALLVFYLTKNRRISDVIAGIKNIEIQDLQPKNMTNFLKNNFKKFLFYSALGMVAKSPWDGLISSVGGVIVVKKDGEIVGYTPYDLNAFQEYLFINTKFDSPDSDRNKFGKIYKEGNEYKIKLNFQIRFID
ncbi:MAG: HpaII family restriction endonuclease [Patescibacteria group bacterium]|jgi:type II restriction enzyme